jgi:precorrin-8X/cobalt-precorrin-8 methylmutase
VTDTNMARMGIRSRDLERFGGRVVCRMDDPATHAAARAAGTTRAAAAVLASAAEMEGGIYVVGNAPTALLTLIELVRAGRARPALIVGLPVGFVNAAESKAALAQLDYPSITNHGRKGGSNVAAAVVNALILMALQPAADARQPETRST